MQTVRTAPPPPEPPKRRRRPLGQLLGFLLGGLLLTAALGVVAVLMVLNHFSRDLPDHAFLKDYQPPVATRAYTSDGRAIASFATEYRVFVPIEAIPERIRQAFISAEDKTFYTHPGFDIEGILNAVRINLIGDRRVGASTITQQVAKNFLLSPEQSMERKIRELILAMRIEKALPKDRILELYLNEIYLGYGSYGVAAAALNYFNKSLAELSLSEIAFIAALAKGPSNYDPVRKADAAIERRDYVLDRMRADGVITDAEANAAKAEALTVSRPAPVNFYSAGFFTEDVRRTLQQRFGTNALYAGGLSVRTTLDPRLQDLAQAALRRNLIGYDRRRGWKGPVARLAPLKPEWARQLAEVKSAADLHPWVLAVVLEAEGAEARLGFADGSTGRLTAEGVKWTGKGRPGAAVALGDVVYVSPLSDPEPAAQPPAARPRRGVQPAAVQPVADAPAAAKGPRFRLEQVPLVSGGMVVMDPHTGRVLAMVGGFSADLSSFNRATQAMRQLGSSFKPFIHLAALDKGASTTSLVLDAPASFSQGPGRPAWVPRNFDRNFLGWIPLRVALERSRNLPTIRLAAWAGMDLVAQHAEALGIYDKMERYLPISLGAQESTVLRLVSAYAQLVNGGRKLVPTLIDRVQDRNGRTIYRHDTSTCENCQSIAFTGQEPPIVVDPRPQVVDPQVAFQVVQELEGVIQRGTARKLMALGRPIGGKTGTSNESRTIWFMGFTPDLVVGTYIGFDDNSPLPGETGSSVPARVVQDFLGEALKGVPAVPFRRPPGMVTKFINPRTGDVGAFGEPGLIEEGFIRGREPGGDQYIRAISGDGAVDDPDAPALPGGDDTGAVGTAGPDCSTSRVGCGQGGVY